MLPNEVFFACREGHIFFSMPMYPDYIVPEADLTVADAFIPDGAHTPYAWKNNIQYMMYTENEEIFYHVADLTEWVDAMRSHEAYADFTEDDLKIEAGINYALFYMNIFGGSVEGDFTSSVLVSADETVSLITAEGVYHYDDMPDTPYHAYIVIDGNTAVALMMTDGELYQELKSTFRALCEAEVAEYDAKMASETVEVFGIKTTLTGRAVASDTDRYEVFTSDHSYCRIGIKVIDLSALAKEGTPFSESSYAYFTAVAKQFAAEYETENYALKPMGRNHVMLTLQVDDDWMGYPYAIVYLFSQDGIWMLQGIMTPDVEQIIASLSQNWTAAE